METVFFFHSVSPHARGVSLVVLAALLMLSAECMSQQVAHRTPAEVPVELSSEVQDYRPFATFGASVGIQTLGVVMTTAITGLCCGFSERSLEVGWGLMLGLTPLADGAVGWAIGSSSPEYSSPFGAMVAGGYIGAVLSYLFVYLDVRRDNPRVDGEYDPIYFNRNPRRNAALNILTLGLAPIFLPATGAALGHLIGRKPLQHSRGITFLPPLPTVVRRETRDRSLVMGVQLLRGSF